jgi:hypothetical protein
LKAPLSTLFSVLALTLASAGHAAGWEYNTSKDKMTGKTISSAAVYSEKSLSFGPPYQGQNMGRLAVRQLADGGVETFVLIEKGQMVCGADCAVRVRFDEAQPVTFSAAGPDDHRSTMLFMINSKRFIAQAKKAKRILVEFTAYQEGNQVLEFSTPDALVWPPKP